MDAGQFDPVCAIYGKPIRSEPFAQSETGEEIHLRCGSQQTQLRALEQVDRVRAAYDFPRAHRKHLRTTNPGESPFAAVWLRTAAAKRYKKVENASAVIWKTLLIAELTFRRLDAPELLAEVAEGVMYVNDERVKPGLSTAKKKAAA